MGQLLEQSIKTFFNGVSRQPHIVRLPSQVQESDNTLLSVVTGGFEKRPGSQHIATLASADTNDDYAVHMIDRDPTEQYVVIVPGDGTLLVYDANTGAAKTVNAIASDGQAYLTGDAEDFAFVSIADYTFVINRTVIVRQTFNGNLTAVSGATGTSVSTMTNPGNAYDGNTGTSATQASATSATLVKDYGSGTPKVINRITASGIVGAATVGVIVSNDNVTYTRLLTATVSGGAVDLWDFATTAYRYVGLVFEAPSATAISVQEVVHYETTGFKGSKQKFSDLSSLTPSSGDIWQIVGDESTDFDNYFVKWDGSVWQETVDPGSRNRFLATTMPYTLVRNADGTFTFAKATWADREVGDEDSNPTPLFVGKALSDIFFHRNRLGLLADEKVQTSRDADFFNFWAEKSTQVLDTDPIDRAATTTRVTLLKWAVPFRKSLFLTAELAQFELSALDKLTPSTAVLDVTTTYTASPDCRPVAMGDTLYFASDAGGASVVWEYYWDDSQLSNTADNITKHCEGYVPSGIKQMVAAPAVDRLFCRTSSDTDAFYVYTAYWDSTNSKAQSAWCRWVFPGAEIRGAAVLGDYLFMVVNRGDQVCLEKVTTARETADPDLGYAVLLDRRTRVTGSYDAMTGKTTWTLPYDHQDDLVAVMTGDFDNAGQEIADLEYPTVNTVTADGDYHAGRVYFGSDYLMEVELSKLYVRDQEGSIISGRNQVRHIVLYFVESGYFEVAVTPKGRAERVTTMSGAIFGGDFSSNVPLLLEDGTVRARVHTDGSTGKIIVRNSSYVPSVITAGAWTTLFNEITRQEV